MFIRNWWQPRSPQYKSVVIILSILMVIGIPASALILKTQRQAARTNLKQSALTIAEMVGRSLEEDMVLRDLAHLEAELARLSDGVYVNEAHVMNVIGEVKFSSDPADLRITHVHSEMTSPVASGEPLFIEVHDKMDEQVMQVILPIQNGQECYACHDQATPVLGLLEVSLNTAAINLQTVRTASLMLVIGVTTFIVIGGALVFMLRQSVLKPLTNQLASVISEQEKEERLYLTGRLATIGELVAGIAHELNNPLTSVIGYSELLLTADVPEVVKQDIKTINEEATRTARIVRNLLTFARKHPDQKQPINLNQTILGVLELRAHEQKMNNITVITHLAPELPEITANPFQLQQVFINIIINAEFFMIQAHQKGALTITTERSGNTVRASIADDGPGIPKENLARIFDPFFTTKEVGKGTGLGLSICHGIVTEHGGKLYAESEPGEGAVFIVELPIEQTDIDSETPESLLIKTGGIT